MTAPQRKDALKAGVTLHSYRIIEVLGAGAFGITYLAEHNLLNTRHVIKEYLPDTALRTQAGNTVSPKSTADQELFSWGLDNFFQEARFVHELNHPNIVKVSDLFEANGTAYFVMPFLDGVTLYQWLKTHPQPSQTELVDIFVPLLEGLKYIHQRNLLHRDIKPENIYITENGNPVLIDFGAARLAIGEKSKALTQVLTPHFAPWEQYRSKGDFGPALDFYSLAACMFQAITGEMPEEAPNRLENDPVLPLVERSDLKPTYSHAFLAAVDKALCVYAKDRFQTAFDFQLALMAEPTPAAQPPAGQHNTSEANESTLAAPLFARRTEAVPETPNGIVPDAPLTIRPDIGKQREHSVDRTEPRPGSRKTIVVVVLVLVLSSVSAASYFLFPQWWGGSGQDNGSSHTAEIESVEPESAENQEAGGEKGNAQERSSRNNEPVEDIDVLPAQDMAELTVGTAEATEDAENENTRVDTQTSTDNNSDAEANAAAAAEREDEALWQDVVTDNTLAAVAQYLEECQVCARKDQAEQLQSELREAQQQRADDQLLWDQALSANSEQEYQAYLENCSLCEQRNSARERLRALVAQREAREQDDSAWATAVRANSESSYSRYLQQCELCAQKSVAEERYATLRDARIAEETALAQEQREEAAWLRAQEEDSAQAYDSYLTSCLTCSHQAAALAALDLLGRLNDTVTVGIEGADFSSIRAAIDRVEHGATVEVLPGIYNESVVINKNIQLVGKGEREQIVIRGSARYALHVQADQAQVRNVTVRQSAGIGSIFAIYINQGSALLENLDASSESGAVIAVSDGATPLIRNSDIHSGAEAGLFIFSGGAARIENNRIYGNGLANIEIRDQGSTPTISDNQIFNANQSGLFIHSQAEPIVSNNTIYSNTLAGISVRDNANPQVRGNEIRDGKEEGIVVYQAGKGRFEENKIWGNERAGVAVYEQGNPSFSNNSIYQGNASGVFVYDGGLGHFNGNQIFQQRLSNIVVTDQGNPRFSNNEIYESEQVGIFIYSNGMGTFENNRIYGNTIAGAEVRTESEPSFSGNHIYENDVGIYVHERGAGDYNANQIENNTTVGFAVASEGNPRVTNNSIENNGDGISAFPRARGTFRGNSVRQNTGRDWAVAQTANISRR